jgi:predicted transcriptional regulator
MTATAKEQIRQILDEAPDDASYEEIEYRIYVRRKLERAMEDIEAGRTVSHAEVKRQVALPYPISTPRPIRS